MCEGIQKHNQNKARTTSYHYHYSIISSHSNIVTFCRGYRPHLRIPYSLNVDALNIT